jgi:hypothetical protein
VKKPTNKYCSVHCCAIDPERLWGSSGANPEAEIDILGEGREDVPRGMSRLVV